MSTFSLPKITSKERARDIATFIRFGHCKKPNPNFVSDEMNLLHVRTVDTKIILFSCPWNSSTVPTLTPDSPDSPNLVNRFLIIFTCCEYGVTVRIMKAC